LEKTVNTLLADEFFGLLEQFGAQIAHRCFAQQIILLLKFLHLSIAHTPILAIREILLHLVPGPHMFLAQCDLHSANTQRLM
jgi:hypothetical protein